MEAALHPYAQGAIVEYVAPFDKKTCQRNKIIGSHPIMVLNGTHCGPCSTVQCMILTSKVDSYYGYRIYLNTMDLKYRKFSVVVSTKVFTIEKAHLRAVLGYASPAFVKKCLNSYLYEVGLSDEIPDYYRNSESLEYINAGEPNVPRTPEGYQIPNMGPDAYKNLGIASDSKIVKPHASGIKSTITRIPVNTNEYDRYIYEHMPIDESEDDEEEKEDAIIIHSPVVEEEPVAEQDESDEAEDVVYGEPVTVNEPAISDMSSTDIPIEKGEIVEPSKRGVYGPNLTHELKDYIEDLDKHILDEGGLPNVTDKVKDLYKNLTDNDKYAIWRCKINHSQMVKEEMAPSTYLAKKLSTYVVACIRRDKEVLITGVLDKRLNLRFLPSTLNLAYRTMTMGDIYDIKMGMATYINYLQAFNIDLEDSYLGELQAAELL